MDWRNDWQYYTNAYWTMIITMTTVGYGDYYPTTILGRMITVITTFVGVFLVGMLVSTLTVSSEFEPKEQRAFDILYRL